MNKRGTPRAFALLCLAFGTAVAAPLEETTEQTYSVPPTVTLSVQNTDGTIYIYGSEKSEIRIVARKRAYSRERLDQLVANVKIDGDRATIDTTFPPKVEGLSVADRSGTMDYVLVVPQTCAVAKAEVVRGEIVLEGLRGKSANGRVRSGRMIVRNSFADSIDVAVTEGMLDFYYDWWEPLKVAISGQIERGHIRSTFPAYSSFGLDAVSGDGKITNKLVSSENGDGDVRSVQMAIGDEPGAAIKLRANYGNITLNRIE